MLRKHIERIVRFPVTTIVLALFATFFFAYQFRGLHMVLDPKALLPQDHPYVQLNNEIEKQFGGSRVVLIGVASEDGDIFNPEDIEKIRQINEEVKKLPGILENNIVSIADRKVKYVKAEGDSLEIRGLLDGIEYTPEGMAELKERVYSNPMFINSLISEDGTVAAIITDFKGGASDWWQKQGSEAEEKSGVRSLGGGEQGGEGKWPAQGQGEGEWPAGGKEGQWPAGGPASGDEGWPGDGGDGKGWEQWYVSDSTIHKKVLEIVDKYRDADTEIYVGGLPIALSFLEADSWRMSRYVYPLALIVIMVILYFAFRSIQGMILPIICALLSVVWAVGLMGIFKIPLDPWNMMTPILILAVAAGHSVQILKRYYEEIAKLAVSSEQLAEKPATSYPLPAAYNGRWSREGSKQAVIDSLTKIGPVMITAGIVAAASFASLITFKLKTFQSFGLFTAFGILSALVLEMTFIPAARSLMRPPRKVAGSSEQVTDRRDRPSGLSFKQTAGSPLDKFLLAVSRLVTRRSWTVWIGLVLVIAISFYGINRLTVINSLKGLFFESTQFRKDDAALNKYFGGTATFYVYIEGQETDSLKDPEVLRAIESLQKEIEAVPEVGKTQSYVDYVKAMNQSMHGGDMTYRTIPDNRSTIAEYLFLFSLSGAQGEMDRFLDYQYQKSVIWVFLRDDSTVLGERLISIVDKYSQVAGAQKLEVRSKRSESRTQNPESRGQMSEASVPSPPFSRKDGEGKGEGALHFPPGIKVGVAGSIPVMMALNQTMVAGKIWNILQIAGIVFVISSIVLRSPVGGILVLLPLAIAVLVNFGVLGIAGIGLGVGTAAISAMAVGFGADYSIYLLYRLREEVAESSKQLAVSSKQVIGRDPIERTLLTAGKAIILVASALAAGGLTLLFTGYYLHMEGFLVPLAMLTSSLATLIVLPAVVRLVKPGFIYK